MLQSIYDIFSKIATELYHKKQYMFEIHVFDFAIMSIYALNSTLPPSFCVYTSHSFNRGSFGHCFKKGKKRIFLTPCVVNNLQASFSGSYLNITDPRCIETPSEWSSCKDVEGIIASASPTLTDDIAMK